jgi:hypothetical protein
MPCFLNAAFLLSVGSPWHGFSKKIPVPHTILKFFVRFGSFSKDKLTQTMYHIQSQHLRYRRMMLLKIGSELLLGSATYIVKKIYKTKVSLQDTKNQRLTNFGLRDIEENLALGTIKVTNV